MSETNDKQGQWDGERCEGCAWHEIDEESTGCYNKDSSRYRDTFSSGGHERCELFQPSLQCRQVRADEERNVLLKELLRVLAGIEMNTRKHQ